MSEAKTSLSTSSSCWVRSHVRELVGVLPVASSAWSYSDTDLDWATFKQLTDRDLIVCIDDARTNTYETPERLEEAVTTYARELGIEFEGESPLAEC